MAGCFEYDKILNEMSLEEIYFYLCNKDRRHPSWHDLYFDDEPVPLPRKNCMCDNCFYGRDKLAMEILKLKGEK